MVYPLEDGHYRVRSVTLKVWETRDLIEVCLDDNGILRRGQVTRLLYNLFIERIK